MRVVGRGHRLAVFIGWLTGSAVLKSLGLDAETMKANTALGLAAAAVCLTALRSPGRHARGVATVAGLLVLLDGAANLCEYVLGVHLGIGPIVQVSLDRFSLIGFPSIIRSHWKRESCLQHRLQAFTGLIP